MCRATLRITLESSTIKQLFIGLSRSFGVSLTRKGNEELKQPWPRRRQSTRRHRQGAEGQFQFPPSRGRLVPSHPPWRRGREPAPKGPRPRLRPGRRSERNDG